MARYQYTKADLKDQFGWSFQQVKTRLRYLQVLLSDHYQGSKGVEYRFDERAMAILRRLYELEKEGHDIKEASKQIIAEVEKPEGEEGGHDIKVDQSTVKDLREEIDHLRSEIKYKNKEIDRLHGKIDRLLPAAQEEEEKKDEFKELSLLQVVKKWFTTKT